MKIRGFPGTNADEGLFRLLGIVKWEVRLQYRSGIYAVYGIMTSFFLFILYLLPQEYRETGFQYLVYFDPSFLGFFFAGGLVLLDQIQGILPVYMTGGRGFFSYWLTKAVALFLLSGAAVGVLTGISIVAGFIRLDLVGFVFLCLGLSLSVPVFFSLGLWVASVFPRVTDYFLFSSLLLFPLMIPLVEIFGISIWPFGVFSPVWGGLVVLTSVFEPRASGQTLALGIATLLLWNGIGFFLARKGIAGLLSGQTRRELFNKSRVLPNTGILQSLNKLIPADIRMILRDPMTLMIAFLPILVAVIMGRGLPFVLGNLGSNDFFFSLLPQGVWAFLGSNIDHFRSFALVLGPVMYGVLAAFLVLDEKDEEIEDFLSTLPVSRPRMFVSRIILLGGLYGIVLLPAVWLGGLVHGVPISFILSLFIDVLALPWVFLGISFVASTKVQGLALAKLMGILILPPLLAMGLEGRWVLLLGLVPTSWGSLIRLGLVNPVLGSAAGLGMNGLAGVWLYRLHRGKPTPQFHSVAE